MNWVIKALYVNILVNHTVYADRDGVYCWLSSGGFWYESMRMRDLLR